MKYIIFPILFLILFTFNVKAHDCILTGTSAEEITIYNTCLAHSKQKKPKNWVTNSMMKLKLQKLKNENLSLKNKLLDIRLRFDNLKSIIDSYTR